MNDLIRPVDSLRDAVHIAAEHGEEGLYDLAERIDGMLDIADDEFKDQLAETVLSWAALLNLPEHVARVQLAAVLKDATAMAIFAFLAGALWKQQQHEQEERDE